ncbi:lyase family protein, partial [Streptomyces flaveolus]|uniref:lyase family protein n=1 Tax=Streptomyces flaveolus TaxID=67297 RepID=UPI00342F1A76
MRQPDTFPSAMHIAAVQQAVAAEAEWWHDVAKIGRTHLEDAVPLTVGQEWSGYARQLEQACERVV